MKHLYSIFSHPVFMAAFFSWFSAQFMKMVVEFFRSRHTDRDDLSLAFLWRTGGMPSSHSAMVTALATSIGFIEGVMSPLFIALLFYGLLVIRDALGVRRAAGAQAKAINELGRELKTRFQIPFIPVKEVNGHTISEVSVGILLGFFTALAFCKL